MKKITISILDNALLFKYTVNKPVSVNLLNTNVISNDELMFSDKYLMENQKITGLFIVDLIKEREINNIIIDSFDMSKVTDTLYKFEYKPKGLDKEVLFVHIKSGESE